MSKPYGVCREGACDLKAIHFSSFCARHDKEHRAQVAAELAAQEEQSMSILDGPGEGTWSVYAMKVSEERDAALELAQGYKRTLERDRLDLITQRDEALRELAAMTQVADQQRERAKAAERGAEYLGRVLVELRKVADRGGLMTIAAAEDRAKGGL